MRLRLRRRKRQAAALFPVELLPHVPDQDGPHAGVGAQQDLQILIVEELDLAAHVAQQALHFVEVAPHLGRPVTSHGRALGLRSWKRSLSIIGLGP